METESLVKCLVTHNDSGTTHETTTTPKHDVLLHALIFVVLGRSNKLPLEIEWDYVLVIDLIYGSLLLALGVYLIKFNMNLE